MEEKMLKIGVILWGLCWIAGSLLLILKLFGMPYVGWDVIVLLIASPPLVVLILFYLYIIYMVLLDLMGKD